MHRVIATIILAGLLLFPMAQDGNAFETSKKFGIQLGGGFGMYDMGDITQGAEYMKASRGDNSLTEADGGPMGSIALLYRSGKSQLWEVGFNPILGVENLAENPEGDTTGQILMHANEFYFKANILKEIGKALQLSLGAGIAYYNTELQIQDDFNRRYNYDADGRAFGLLGSAGLEISLGKRTGLILAGGGRLVNVANFSYESTPGTRSFLPVIGGSRPMEVNLSGVYGLLALRFYFDKFTKPVDYRH